MIKTSLVELLIFLEITFQSMKSMRMMIYFMLVLFSGALSYKEKELGIVRNWS